MNSKICELLDIEFPLVAFTHCRDVVVAVSKAGGCGVLGAVGMSPEQLEKELKWIDEHIDGKPYGVDVLIPNKMVDQSEKFDAEKLKDMIPQERLDEYIKRGVIEIAPLAYMRGRTLDDAFVILDEAQNTTKNQMKMFLTRMGKKAKFMITGDPGQIDLSKPSLSGLKKANIILQNVEGIEIVYLDGSDVIRHKLVTSIIDAYNKNEDI